MRKSKHLSEYEQQTGETPSATNANPIIVSLTSYPARIDSVAAVIESIQHQSLQPDCIALYLSRDQFHHLEEDLPSPLLRQIQQGAVVVQWVDGDLGSHKKFFYAFREFPEALIVTIDDDVIYPSDFLAMLYQCHLSYPRAVIAARTHYMTFTAEGTAREYLQWLNEFDGLIDTPSMRLLATGVGGILYPVHLFSSFDFGQNGLLAIAPNGDDLLLKAVEAYLGIPVVLEHTHRALQYLPGTQEVGLFHHNQEQGENDIKWDALRSWFKQFKSVDLDELISTWDLSNHPASHDKIINHFTAKLMEEKGRAALLEAQIDNMHSSTTWIAGRTVTWLPRTLKNTISKIKLRNRV